MEKKTELIQIRIGPKKKSDFLKALEILEKTISGAIYEHIKKEIIKADKIKTKTNL